MLDLVIDTAVVVGCNLHGVAVAEGTTLTYRVRRGVLDQPIVNL